ncbi:immunity 42 family protein [Paramuribaculum intestinale]|uniref:immunity 42 family protein n=1 Tax=Paramuribaculum intestinale TaxID=2094151 RepID=UPI0025A51CD2|nr:immunity 42 family protein [Paramuribaculum intestinale]
MIIGDPYKFAIIIEFVPDWNTQNSWRNGIILFSINGNLLCDEIRTSTLNVDLHELINNIKRIESDVPISTLIYNMDKHSAFIEMYNASFPSDINTPNNYIYRVSTTELEDDGYYIFAVANNDSIRILGGKIKMPTMECDNIVEVFLSRCYLSHFLEKLICSAEV